MARQDRPGAAWIDGPYHPAYIGQTVWTYSGIDPGSRGDTYRDFGFGPDLDSQRIYPGEPGYAPPPLPQIDLPPVDVFVPPPPAPPPADVPTQIALPPGVVTPTPTPTPIPTPPIGATPNVPVPVPSAPLPDAAPRAPMPSNATPIGVDWLYGKRDAFLKRRERILDATERMEERRRQKAIERAAKKKAEYEAQKRVIEGTVLRRAMRVGNIVGAILEVLWPTELGDATLPTSRRNKPDLPPPGTLPPLVLDTTLPPLPPPPRSPRRARTSRPPELPPSSVPAPVLDTALPDLGETTSQPSRSPSRSASTAPAPSSTLPGMDWAALLFPFATLLPRSPTRMPGRTFFSPPSVTTPAPTPTTPLPFTPPTTRTPTITELVPQLFGPTIPQTPTSAPSRECRCPKPKKRKKGCTNELISTRRRDGFIYTKRKATCPPSKRNSRSAQAPRTRTSSLARLSSTAVAGIF